MALITNLVTAALSKIVGEEICAWSPRVITVIVNAAVRLLPHEQRERFAEEWHSYLDEIPGTVGKLIGATGLLVASCRIRMADWDDRYDHPRWMDGPKHLKQAYLRALDVIRDVAEDENLISGDLALGSLVQTLDNSLTEAWGPYEETAERAGEWVEELKRRRSKHNKLVNEVLDIFWYRRVTKFLKPRYDALLRSAEQIDKTSEEVLAIMRKKRENRNAC
jgi:hypothetical protein